MSETPKNVNFTADAVHPVNTTITGAWVPVVRAYRNDSRASRATFWLCGILDRIPCRCASGRAFMTDVRDPEWGDEFVRLRPWPHRRGFHGLALGCRLGLFGVALRLQTRQRSS